MEIEPKKSKNERPRRLIPVDLDYIGRQFNTVLKREANRLLDESYAEKLSEESSKTLVNYIKLLRDLKQDQIREFEGMTDEQLEEILKKGDKK